MKLRLEPFTIILVGLMVLSFFVGRDTCACGDLPPVDPIATEIKAPTI